MKAQPRTWFRFEAKADDPTAADLYIYSDIGQSWWSDETVTLKSFMAELAELPAAVVSLTVHVNSLGGDVFDAVGIANALRTWRSEGRAVTTVVDGIAASAASIVIMAGDIVRIADNALVMVHLPWTIGIGNAGDMRKTADRLDLVRDQIVATYRWHSALEPDALVALMEAETWMDADEALANGFATEKVEGLAAAAHLDSPHVRAKLTIPAKFQARVEALMAKQTDDQPETMDPDENGNCQDGYEKGDDGMCHMQSKSKKDSAAAPALDVLRLCREGGVSDLAEGLIAAGATAETIQATVAETKAARQAESERQTREAAAAQARARDITALCTAAKMPELAAGYIAGAMAVDAVRAQLTTITAKLDRTEIDTGIDSDPAGTLAASWKRAFSRVQSRRASVQ